MLKARVVNRGKYGWMVAWSQEGKPGEFESAMPTEVAARTCAVAFDMLAVLQTVRDDLGIKEEFAPIGTLNFANQLTKAINAATMIQGE